MSEFKNPLYDRNDCAGIHTCLTPVSFYCNNEIAKECAFIETDVRPAQRGVYQCRCRVIGADWCLSLRCRAEALRRLIKRLDKQLASIEKDIRDGAWLDPENNKTRRP